MGFSEDGHRVHGTCQQSAAMDTASVGIKHRYSKGTKAAKRAAVALRNETRWAAQLVTSSYGGFGVAGLLYPVGGKLHSPHAYQRSCQCGVQHFLCFGER